MSGEEKFLNFRGIGLASNSYPALLIPESLARALQTIWTEMTLKASQEINLKWLSFLI